MAPNNRKLYDYFPSMLRNEQTRQGIESMFDSSTFASDDFSACLLYVDIDSYFSDSPEPITIIYVAK